VIVRKCAMCGSLVWFWQSKGELTLELKNGESRTVHLCLGCGVKIALKTEDRGEEEAE